MPSTFSPSLRLELMADGENTGLWGQKTNTNLGTLLEQAITGYTTVNVTTASQALTNANGATDQARQAMLNITVAHAGNVSLFAPPVAKQYIIRNASTTRTVTIFNSTVIGNTTAAGAGIAIPPSSTRQVWSDGTNFLQLTYDETNVMKTTAYAPAGLTFLASPTLSNLSFTQSGTGAVARTLQAKLQDSVSVLDFGADPTGVADSTAAIQAAINVTTVNTVYVPPGTYRVTGAISLRDGVTIRGAGRTTTTFSKTNFADACFKGIDVDHVSLADFAIVGPGQFTGTGNKGILIAISTQEICTSISLARIDVSLVNDICVYVGTGAFVSYDNVRCRTYGYCGFFVDGGDGHTFTACTTRGGLSGCNVGYFINRTGGYGPTTVTMTGCYAEQAGRGVVFLGAVSCAAIGCGVEAAIYVNATDDGTNWDINGGANVSLINCLSRNDTIGVAISSPHVRVRGSATQVLIDGFTRENSSTFGPPTWELDVTAASNVSLGRNNFTPARINSGTNILRYSIPLRFESAELAIPAFNSATLPASTQVTVTATHGGPRKPDLFRVVIRRNSTAGSANSVDASYVTGDEVEVADIIIASNTSIGVWANATTCGYSQLYYPPNIAYKGSNYNANINTACWNLVFYAVWF